jgi:hypothetical protein
MSKTTKDKDDRMTITVEKGEETISFQTDPNLHISEFRDLMMRLAAAVGYQQSNIEEYFLQDEEKSECCGAKYDRKEKLQRNKPNEETISNFQKPTIDMGGNLYERDDTFV